MGMLACNTDNSSETTEAESSTETPASSVTIPPLETAPVIVEQPGGTTINPPALSGQFANTKITATGGLNPAHGMPGHDCAIAVGAPLKVTSSASTTAPSAASSAKVITTAPVSAPIDFTGIPTNVNSVASPSNGKVNPAHGQPGHDCAVAVGAPLPVK